MSYTTLDVVNDMLALLGELPVNDLETPHPAVPGAMRLLDSTNTLLQAERWWFNTEYTTLTPQVGNKRIVVPGDTAAADTLTRVPAVTVRGMYLYNTDDGTYEFDAPVKVRLHRVVPFEQLPLSARRYVALAAQLKFQTTIDADALKTRELKEERHMAYMLMNAEHTRNARANMLARPGVAYILNNMQGQSPFAGRIKY